MPMYDRKCGACGAIDVDCYEPVAAPDRECLCGGVKVRVWLPQTIVGCVDDSWPGGKTFEHLAHEPVTFHSRSEYRRFLQATGQMEFVRHVGKPGSDKSPHTSRWV